MMGAGPLKCVIKILPSSSHMLGVLQLGRLLAEKPMRRWSLYSSHAHVGASEGGGQRANRGEKGVRQARRHVCEYQTCGAAM